MVVKVIKKRQAYFWHRNPQALACLSDRYMIDRAQDISWTIAAVRDDKTRDHQGLDHEPVLPEHAAEGTGPAHQKAYPARLASEHIIRIDIDLHPHMAGKPCLFQVIKRPVQRGAFPGGQEDMPAVLAPQLPQGR